MKAKRKEVGLSAEEVAKSLNVSTATIYRYEKGDIAKLPGSILEPLSHILHTTPAHLMGWEAEEASITTVGERIKGLRKQYGMSQTELASLIQSTKQNVYKYENGIISNVPSDKIEAIAKALHTTPAYLMGWGTDASSRCNLLENSYPQNAEVYRMHFSELLMRYETLIEHAVYARSNTEKYLDSIKEFNSERIQPLNEQQLTEQYLRQELQDDLNNLVSWINTLPMYLSNDNQQPDS